MGDTTEAEAVAELLGVTTEHAAELLRQVDDEFHPERLVREISESLSAAERVEFEARVRTAMVERPEISVVEHMLEAAVAIEAERN